VPVGKSKKATRSVTLTGKATAILERRRLTSTVPWIFPNEKETGPAINTTIDHQHARVRDALHLSEEFVLHSLRHTMLTRLAKATKGNKFLLKQVAGHASVTTLERYIHPDDAEMDEGIKRMERAHHVAASGHRVGTRRKPVKAKSLQTAVIKQAGA